MSNKLRAIVSKEFVDYINSCSIDLNSAIIMKCGKDNVVPLWYDTVNKMFEPYSKSVDRDTELYKLCGLTLYGEFLDLAHVSLTYYTWRWAREFTFFIADAQLIKMRNALRWSTYILSNVHMTNKYEVIMFHTSNKDVSTYSISLTKYNSELGCGFYMVPYVDAALQMWNYSRNPRTGYRASYVNIYALSFLPERRNGSSFINSIGGQCIIKTQEELRMMRKLDFVHKSELLDYMSSFDTADVWLDKINARTFPPAGITI